MAGVNSVFSFKVLAAITVAVLWAHLVVLRASPTVLRPSQAEQPLHTFITRSIEPIVAPLAAPRSAIVPAAAAPPSGPRARPHPARSARSPISGAPRDSEQVAAALPPPQAQEESAASSPQEESAASSPQEAPTPAPTDAAADQLALAPSVSRPPRQPTPTGAASKLPAPVRLKYLVQANKFPYRLGAELLWQQTDEQYTARLEIGAFGQARVQTSRGQITAQGLAPLRFSDKYRSEVATHFNRAQGKVTFSANTPDAPLLAGAQDRLSVLVQLAALLASAPEDYPQATTISIQVIGPRDADIWLFTVGAPETLPFPGGEQATIKLVRNPREAFDQTVELWLAPALGYLPARIRITEANGDFVDQQWLATEPPI